MSEAPHESLSISTGTLVRAALVVVSFMLLWYLRNVALVVLTSVVIASAIEPLTLWLRRYGISRLISVLGAYLALSLAFVGVFYFFVPSFLSDAASFLRTVPSFLETLPSPLPFTSDAVEQGANLADTLSRGLTRGGMTGEGMEASSLTAVFTDLSQIFQSFASGFWDNVSIVFGGILSFILIVVLSFYLAAQEDGVEKFLRIVTPARHENYIIGLWKRSQRKIGYWMQGQILLAFLVGILVYLGLTILGIRNALSLAVLAAILEVIPLFGPILSAIPAIGVAFVSGTLVAAPGFTSVLLVAGLYLVIQQFENHLIYPHVVKKIVGVPPLLAILSLIVGAQLAGFIGLILSVPIAATLMEYLDDIQKSKSAALNT